MALIFVDCEAYGGAPATGRLTEFGAVEFKTGKSFYAQIVETKPDPKNPAVPLPVTEVNIEREKHIFQTFEAWLKLFPGRPIFISDNNGFDWQWINDGFWRHLGYNPFGHSSRRIGDFYAGVMKDFRAASKWKRYRITPHDHNPVNDARGNVEAFRKILEISGVDWRGTSTAS